MVDFVRLNNKSVGFTQFPDQWAKAYRSRELDWENVCRMIEESNEYEEKGDAPWIKLAVFNGEKTKKGCYRHNAGVQSVTGIECDYDEEGMSVEDAAKKLKEAQVCCFIYTSGSYTEETPRWRVLAPFSSPYSDTEERMKEYRTEMIKRLESVLGIRFASESHTLSQAYYYGRIKGKPFKTFRVSGEFVTERWDLSTFETAEAPLEHYTRVDRAQLVSDVLTERAYHTSLRSLAAAMAHDGNDYSTIETFLHGLMDAVPHKGHKWQDRRDSIAGLIRTALRKFGSGQESEVAYHKFEGVPVTPTGLLLAKEQNPFSFIIDTIMPAAVMGITGAGGSNKSTMVLWTMLHICTGRPVFDLEVLRTGCCVFITAEDEREMVVHRVQRMCEALEMTEEEMEMVGNRLFIEDVSGVVCRLVESKRDGNLDFSATVDEIITTYTGKGVVFLAFDPATYFGAGERFVNDGDSLLMKAGRRVSSKLGCAVAFVHHVGKQQGREKQLDQYAGRGGSAFADNSRAMWTMAPYDVGDKKVGAIPEDIQEMIADGCQVSRLVVPKMSYGQKPNETLWIGREKNNPWMFHTLWSSVEDKARTNKETKESAEDTTTRQIALIIKELIKQLGQGTFPSKRALRGSTIMDDETKLSAARISTLVDVAESRNLIYQEDLPEHLIRGARKTYLAPRTIQTNSKPIEDAFDEIDI